MPTEASSTWGAPGKIALPPGLTLRAVGRIMQADTPMPLPTVNLTHLISAAVAPVVLISAAAILLSGYSAKYGSVSDRMRDLTGEYRRTDTPAPRRAVIKIQLLLFRRRIIAVWAASALLSIALLLFLGTVLSVILSTHEARLGWVGAACLVSGLVLMVGAVSLELYEIRLARFAVDAELSDIFGEDEPGGAVMKDRDAQG